MNYRLGCRIGLYVVTVLQHYETWVVVVVTFERYMSIMHPLKSRVYLSRGRLKVAFYFILAFCFIYHVPHVITYDISDDDEGLPCQPTGKFGLWWEDNYKPIASLILFAFGPFGIIFLCNIIIIGKLIKMQKTRSNLGVSEEQQNTKKRLKKMVPLLMSLSFVFLITQGPYQIQLTPPFYFEIWSDDPTEQQYHSLWYNMIYTFANLNYSTNFFLYVLTHKVCVKTSSINVTNVGEYLLNEHCKGYLKSNGQIFLHAYIF